MPAWTLTWRGRREVVPVAGGMLGVIVGEPSRSSIATRHVGVGPTVPTSVRREGEKGRQQLACRSHAGGGGGGHCLASRSSSSTSCGERRTAMTLQPTRRHPRSEATSVAACHREDASPLSSPVFSPLPTFFFFSSSGRDKEKQNMSPTPGEPRHQGHSIRGGQGRGTRWRELDEKEEG
jgi:hypothetical protein